MKYRLYMYIVYIIFWDNQLKNKHDDDIMIYGMVEETAWH